MFRFLIVLTLALSIFNVANAKGTRIVEFGDTGIELTVPAEWRMLKTTNRSFVLTSRDGKWRGDLYVINEAKKLSDAVSNLKNDGFDRKWEFLRLEVVPSQMSEGAVRADIRMPAEGKHFMTYFHLENINGRTIILSLATEDVGNLDVGIKDLKFADHVISTLSVMGFEPKAFEGS